MTTTQGLPPVARLSAPLLGSSVVDRPRIVEALDDAVERASVTLVLGYPGAGKSTVLASWARRRSDLSISWLACDDAELDPVRFWQAVVAALRRVAPKVGADLLDAVELGGELTRDMIGSLVDDLANLATRIVLIVDDLQRAASPALWPLLTAFVEWLPSQHRVVFSGRTDPVLPLHRWRIEGRLAELRNSDLAFRDDEVTDLLAALGVAVDEPTADFLTRRTEGWAAGLQLAGLNVRDHDDANRFLREFAATDRHLVDYLVGEVLEQQPPEIVDFLLATCVVRDLESGLCVALTGDPHAGRRLHEIESLGLFLIPLDRDRRRYRYHHLFAEMLRNRLRHDDPSRKLALHRAAADWYAAHGQIGRAVNHAVRGDDTAHAISLLRTSVVDAYFAHEPVSLESMTDAIDPGTLGADKSLALEYALAIGMSGELDAAGVWLRRLRKDADHGDPDFDLRLTIAEAMLDMSEGRAEQALSRIATHTGRVEPAGAAGVQIRNTTIRCHSYLGDLQRVRSLAAPSGSPTGEPFGEIVRASALSSVEFEAGYIDGAEAIAESAIRLADEFGSRQHFGVGDALRVTGAVALERLEPKRAEDMLEAALNIAEAKRPVLELLCLIDRSGLALETQRVDEATDMLAAAEQIVTKLQPSRAIADRLLSAQARLQLEIGGVQHAADLAASMRVGRRRAMVEIRVALARQMYTVAESSLRRVQTDGWPRFELERALLSAQLGVATDQREEIVDAAIEEALTIADDQRFLRTVLIDFDPIADEFGRVLRRAEVGSYRALIASAARVRLPVNRDTVRRGSSLDLSEREHEVLRYLSTQMSNREIAGTLFVSLNTMKTHVRSLYRKLDASTRSQAVAAGRDRGLL